MAPLPKGKKAIPIAPRTAADVLREKAAQGAGIMRSAASGPPEVPPGFIDDLKDAPGMARSALSGITSNAAPHVLSAIDSAIGTPPDAPIDPRATPEQVDAALLRQWQRRYGEAVERHPIPNIVGAVAQPSPLGKLKGASAIGKLGLASARVGQAGAQDALTRYLGEEKPGTQGFDPTSGLLLPMGIQAGAEVLSPALGKLGSRYTKRAAEVRSAKAAKDAAEMLARRTGAYGQKVQDAERTTENLMRKLEDPNVDEETKTQIRFFLDSDEGVRQTNQIATNSLDRAPGKFREMAELKALRDSAPEDAAKETADYFSKSTLRHDVLPRVKNYASRMIPQAAADAAGDFAGGAKGVAAGVAGALSGAALGRPGTSLANLLQKTPRFSSKLFDTLGSAAGAGGRINRSPAAAGTAGNLLENYLRPKDDEEREEGGAAWMTGR